MICQVYDEKQEMQQILFWFFLLLCNAKLWRQLDEGCWAYKRVFLVFFDDMNVKTCLISLKFKIE